MERFTTCYVNKACQIERDIMKRYLIAMLTLCSLATGCAKPSSDVADIQHTFDAYKAAILSTDGSAAVRQIAQPTLNEYQNYIDWCLHADRETLQSLSALNKMQVFLLKHRIPADELKQMNGEKAFVYAVDHDWIGKEGTAVTTIADIQVSGDTASAATQVNGRKQSIRFNFVKENGRWKLDLTKTLQDTDALLGFQISQAGVPENEYILRSIEMITGRKVADNIWDPMESK